MIDSRQSRIVLATVVLLVGALAAFWLLFDDGATRDSAGDLPSADTLLDPAWDGESRRSVDLSLDASRGPIWQRDEPIVLGPGTEANLSWTRRDTDRAIELTGRGRWHDVPVTIRWHLRNGDPQARLDIRLADVPLPTLRDHGFTATLVLPEGPIDFIDRSLNRREWAEPKPRTLAPWQPTRLTWGSSADALSISEWTGDGATLRPADDGGVAIDLHLWRPDAHPAVSACKTAEDRPSPTATIGASARVSIGAPPPLFASRFRNGADAALVPIFDTQDSHPDTTLHRGGPETPADWAARARTLAFGHSNPDDPRYGNGGLLGHGLGGTLVVDASMAAEEPVERLRADVGSPDLDIAVRGTPSEDTDAFATRLGAETSCASLVDGSTILVDGFAPLRGAASNLLGEKPGKAVVGAPSHPVATIARPERLDGRRPSLLDYAFSSDVLEPLIDARGLAVVATPLTGSRNPLIPAAKEALVDPERHGAWTLSGPVSRALANLELLREMEPLSVASLSGVVDYWRRARRVDRQWTGDRHLLVRNTTSQPIDGYTLILDGVRLSGDAVVLEDDTPVRTRTSPPNTPARTWIWWRLEPEATDRLQIDKIPDGSWHLAPVNWDFDK